MKETDLCFRAGVVESAAVEESTELETTTGRLPFVVAADLSGFMAGFLDFLVGLSVVVLSSVGPSSVFCFRFTRFITPLATLL